MVTHCRKNARSDVVPVCITPEVFFMSTIPQTEQVVGSISIYAETQLSIPSVYNTAASTHQHSVLRIYILYDIILEAGLESTWKVASRGFLVFHFLLGKAE